MEEIIFNLDRDNRPLIEHFDKNSMKGMFFHRQYAMALRSIARYLREEKNAPKENEFEKYTDGNNNLFAFVSDRGTGKTSCMLSVANSLVHKTEDAHEQDIINQTEFFTIGLLDPSYFDSDHDILMLFVAKLYSLFSEKAKKIDPDTDNYAEKMQLLKDFSSTQKHIHSLLQNTDKIEGDEFERLTSYAVAIDLKKDIFKLIDDYRKFIRKPNATMLLMVDDIDLNTSEASKMAELLRKYFVHSHTIVLISVKLDQLSCIKKQDLIKEFDKIINTGIEHQDIDEMAERYLSKFMPQEHRIFLPTPELYFNNKLIIKYGERTKSFCSVMQAIPELIYQKTRYLFYNFDEDPSYIIPRNLRDLRQLLKVLAEMEGDLDSYDLTEEEKERNREVFQNYLYEDWVVNNLNNKTVRQVKQILASDGANQLNNTILQVIKERYQLDTDYNNNIEINYIKSNDNQSYNISIGDIVGLLNMLSVKNISVDDKKFFFIVYTILSMKLYEYQGTLYKKQTKEGIQQRVSPQRYMDNSSNYFKLIGGRLINSNLIELLPRKDSGDSLSRSNRTVEADKVVELITKVQTAGQKDYRALELFILCTFRTASSRKDSFRTHNRVVHTDFLGDSNFVFEIGALFNNILNKDGCYQRFSKLGGVYEAIVNEILTTDGEKKTLYQLLDNEVCQHMSFRSMDLLQYFINYITNIRYTSLEDPFTVICNFLTKVAEFSFMTYKPTDKGTKTKVSFNQLNSVFSFTDNTALKEQFNGLFGDERDHSRSQGNIEANT